ncbi:MAG: mevalonate kinase [Cryomorphaceae bacterium]|jgi:mevalonate kinase|nr:mevalonate kinase [Cryomorphaceae bacterium]
MNLSPKYFAKILLFGEYGVIRDAMALSIPYTSFSGVLRMPEGEASFAERESNASLNRFASYLEELAALGSLMADLDLSALRADIDRGLFFDSSIPQGYGVGSSGAMVAALYARYARNPLPLEEAHDAEKLKALKAEMAQMECYFHGKSSGMDPTICYLQLPLLVRSSEELGTVRMPSLPSDGLGGIFLLNSGTPGETQPMVQLFMEKLKEEGFRRLMTDRFKKYNDACVAAFLDGKTDVLLRELKKLSGLVLENFGPMIPNDYHSLWQKGIDTNAYYLKLCGSGGGGYILGFAPDLEQAQAALNPHRMDVVLRF